MAKITDITKNDEKIIVVWQDQKGEHISYFEPDVTKLEVEFKLKQISNGFSKKKELTDMIGVDIK